MLDDRLRTLSVQMPDFGKPGCSHPLVLPGHGSGIRVEHVVVFTALAGRDDRKSESMGPRDKANQEARLIAVDECIRHAREARFAGQKRPNNTLGLLTDHGDATTSVDRSEREP